METENSSWEYKRLADSEIFGSIVNWHSYEKAGVTVDFSYDNGDDSDSQVRVNGLPWGSIALDHYIFDSVDFDGSKPIGLEKVADYIVSNTDLASFRAEGKRYESQR